MKRRKAFTIVEIIIGAAILVFILGFAISFMRDTQRQGVKATIIATLRQEAQILLRAMERDISGCLVIPDGFDSNNIEKFKPDYDLGTSPRFKVAKVNGSSENTPIFDVADSSVSGEDITYSVGSDGVCRRGGQVVARYVKSINTEEGDWKNDTEQRGKVMITVNMEAKVPGFTDVASYTQRLMVSVRQLQNLDSLDKFKGRNKHWRQHLEE
jgi:type II secretory pathway pseudopilin PulG